MFASSTYMYTPITYQDISVVFAIQEVNEHQEQHYTWGQQEIVRLTIF